MNKLKLFILLVLAVFVLLSLTEETSAVVFSLSHRRTRVVRKHEKRKRNRSMSRTEENTRRQKKYHKKMKELERWNQRFAQRNVSWPMAHSGPLRHQFLLVCVFTNLCHAFPNGFLLCCQTVVIFFKYNIKYNGESTAFAKISLG